MALDNALGLSRRTLLASIAAVPVAGFAKPRLPATEFRQWSRPGTAAWPTKDQWASLSRSVGGRLILGDRPPAPPAAELLSNPFYVRDQVGLTQSSGWLGAWRSQPSAYAVRAASADDVAAAVRFAQKHAVRLVTKGGGHSYMGGSNAADSLLVWTRSMDDIILHDAFVPKGCSSAPVPAVSVGAGCIWLHVYQAVCVGAGRYVQGGGCTTVGVAGLVQGGGFGSFSKGFGLAAASLLEAEIVTADGRVRIVNACRDPDLFWALKGGGGGTFGIVTRLTLRTHELPATAGAVMLKVRAQDDESFRHLVDEFLRFYSQKLMNPHWGEQVRATPNRELAVQMVFQGLSTDAAKAAWQPFLDKIASHENGWTITQPFAAAAVPARKFWDTGFLAEHVPQAIKRDGRAEARPGDYWWTGDGDQVGAYWSGYRSVWLTQSLLKNDRRQSLAEAWSAAARHWPVTLHFNKGLVGAAPEVIARSSDTAMNPQVLDAFALAVIAGSQSPAYAGWSEPDVADAKLDSARIDAAERSLRAVTGAAGSYMSECDFFLDDWKRASWGHHWRRLEAIKDRYDPQGMFVVHHGVGSDRWDRDHSTRGA